ncbi:arylesterase [Falsiroseomonas sp. HW251]|uniref:arylesterase n=1 Tax=Falsiroseomonas sp. HW251 TaxID=3390998 RepID=UPI003D3158B0
MLLATSVVPGAAHAQATQGGEIRLLMLGDSITAGYGLARNEGPPARIQALLRERGRNVRVLDAGVSGDTSAGGRARIQWALADRPQAAIVALGGNDGLRGLTPAQMKANLEAILDALKARGIPTLLAGMIAPPNLGRDYGQEFFAVFETLHRERPDLVFYPFLLDGVAGDSALNQADRIHPTAQGADLIARRMLPFIETLLDRVRVSAAG